MLILDFVLFFIFFSCFRVQQKVKEKHKYGMSKESALHEMFKWQIKLLLLALKVTLLVDMKRFFVNFLKKISFQLN